MQNKKSFKEMGSFLGEKLDKVAENVNNTVKNFDSKEFSNKVSSYSETIINKASNLKQEAGRRYEEYCSSTTSGEYCACCGNELNRSTKREIANGIICKNCADRFSKPIKKRKLSLKDVTLEELLRFEKNDDEEKLEEKERSKSILKKIGIVLAVILALNIIGTIVSPRSTSQKGKTTTVSAPKNQAQSETKETAETEMIELPLSSGEYIGRNYEKTVEELKSIGFTSILVTAEKDILSESDADKIGTISKISVNGNDSFEKNTTFSKESNIEIVYRDLAETENEIITSSGNSKTQDETVPKKDHVSYSTNDKKTVKNGNSGVYSYVSSGTYDVYYIIDFDEGYVYFFEDGNGSETCDRLKIDSGDLNEGLYYTYHDGDYTWTENLHFKWKRQPDRLVWTKGYDQMADGFVTTNLEKALEIRDRKKIFDY